MEANARNLERIFGATIQYQVPLFQRPYVWTPEANLEPLWEDVLALLARRLSGGKVHPHFMGAVVLEQLAHNTGSIENRQVVDGQQRFTTLQLLLIAARDHARAAKHSKYAERFGSFVENGANFIDSELESFKLCQLTATGPHSAQSSKTVRPNLRPMRRNSRRSKATSSAPTTTFMIGLPNGSPERSTMKKPTRTPHQELNRRKADSKRFGRC